MGDHGVYVWSVYIVSIGFLIGLGMYPLMSLRHLKRKNSNREEIE
ncbi:MAG: heme exporter protein CcmD [Gammaproteobacteria bacterium]|nr:heme exporter protein CcmD [Gammaproteobacteria bacterium]